MQIVSRDLYFDEPNNNTNAKHLYPKRCFLEVIKSQKQ